MIIILYGIKTCSLIFIYSRLELVGVFLFLFFAMLNCTLKYVIYKLNEINKCEQNMQSFSLDFRHHLSELYHCWIVSVNQWETKNHNSLEDISLSPHLPLLNFNHIHYTGEYKKQNLFRMAQNIIPSWIKTSLIWILSCCWIIHANHDAKRLYDDLLKKNHYSKLIRPVKNHTEAIKIKLGMKLTQIIDVVSESVCLSTCHFICPLSSVTLPVL